MKLILIAAVSMDGVIGIDDKIPWRIPEDFKHFRETTMGNMLLVGATTFLTLPPKAHEGREFIILNNGKRFDLKDAKYFQFSALDTVMSLITHDNVNLDKVFVIGGASIYEQLIDYCDEAIITWVNKNYPEGNKKFPIDKLFVNFTPIGTTVWMKSKTGFTFKHTNYKRKDGSPKKTKY